VFTQHPPKPCKNCGGKVVLWEPTPIKIIPKIEEYNKKLISEQYEKLITEVQSISSHVEIVSNHIFNLIKENPNLTKIENVDFIGSADIELKAVDFSNNIQFKGFSGNSDYTNNKEKVYIYNNQIYGIEFYIEYATENGEIVDNNILDMIYHEIQHAYQDYCKLLGGVDIYELPKNKLYNFALEYYGSKNYYLHNFSNILYMANDGEQDSFINQLYSSLKYNEHINKFNIYSYYHTNEAYLRLQNLLKLKEEIPQWNENSELFFYMETALMQYGIKFTKSEIIKLLKNTIVRYSRKLKKMFAKIMMEKNITEHISISRRNPKFVKNE